MPAKNPNINLETDLNQHPNLEWSDRYQKIRKANDGRPRNSQLGWHTSRAVRKGAKRTRVQIDADDQADVTAKVRWTRPRAS